MLKVRTQKQILRQADLNGKLENLSKLMISVQNKTE